MKLEFDVKVTEKDVYKRQPFYREIMETEWVKQSVNIWGVSAA